MSVLDIWGFEYDLKSVWLVDLQNIQIILADVLSQIKMLKC